MKTSTTAIDPTKNDEVVIVRLREMPLDPAVRRAGYAAVPIRDARSRDGRKTEREPQVFRGSALAMAR